MTGWTTDLTRLLAAVARGESGQVGGVVVTPPDPRIPVNLRASAGGPIRIKTEADTVDYSADKAVEAVSDYVARVEGYS